MSLIHKLSLLSIPPGIFQMTSLGINNAVSMKQVSCTPVLGIIPFCFVSFFSRAHSYQCNNARCVCVRNNAEGERAHVVEERNGNKGCYTSASGFYLDTPSLATPQLSVSVLYLRLMCMILLMRAVCIRSYL
jgi:hypothetical protein